MEPRRHVTRALHDEHMATVAAIESLESLLRAGRGSLPPNHADPKTAAALGDVAKVLASEVSVHFTFEEEELFPLLSEFGDSPIGMILSDEHAAILPLARRVTEIAREAAGGGFTEESWAEFRRLGPELVERMISHIQKEEMALLPALDDLLDDDSDNRLSLRYAEIR